MGFQEPTSFKTVLELTFKDGRLTDSKDRSKEMEQEREVQRQEYESEYIYEEVDEASS
jgi:hypothetical protein